MYCDTESVVFITAPGQWDPPLGDYLGDLTDEVQQSAITAFVTSGPNNYAYTLQNANKKWQFSICKLRGITLNFKYSFEINFETVNKIENGRSNCDRVSLVNENTIVRNPSTGHVITKREMKDYRIVFEKRVITDGSHTQPYGY